MAKISGSKGRNPAWTRDEHILALDHYIKNRDSHFAPESKAIISLAKDISSIASALGLTGSDTFRNPTGVSMKLQNYRAIDPESDTKGLSQGSKLEPILWREFATDPERLSNVAQHIRDSIDAFQSLPPPNDDEYEAAEGRVLTRIHSYRERDRKIVQRKKINFLKTHGSLHCEACQFDFLERYGERGANFIECHHTKPVSELTSYEKTKISDLVLLCANCHRMVHSARPWWSIKQLKDALQAQNPVV